MKTALFLLSTLAGAAAILAAQPGPQVAYPNGYRQWAHVKSMVIQEGHPLYDTFGGIHHVYANDKALKALEEKQPFANGSVLVFDLLEAKSEGSALSEGARKVVGVMEKDGKRFAATGGWGFEGFKGDTRERAVTDAKAQCFSCHESQKAADYVFTAARK